MLASSLALAGWLTYLPTDSASSVTPDKQTAELHYLPRHTAGVVSAALAAIKYPNTSSCVCVSGQKFPQGVKNGCFFALN